MLREFSWELTRPFILYGLDSVYLPAFVWGVSALRASNGLLPVCVSWDLSRTYPQSLGQNWDLFPCSRLSPALCRAVQVTRLSTVTRSFRAVSEVTFP